MTQDGINKLIIYNSQSFYKRAMPTRSNIKL